MSSSPLDYDNRTGRPPGRAVRAMGLVLPGIGRVRSQVDPYADHWVGHNRDRLAEPLGERRWVVLGDSMVQGVGASSPASGLVGQLVDRLGNAGHPLDVVNLSATGARVADVLDQQLPLLATLPPHPGGRDLVSVVVGSNDLFAGRRHSRELPAAMARLADALPSGAVVATLPQPRSAARLANAPLDAAAAAGRLRLVDLRVSGPPSWRGLVAADLFHPNDAGYAALARAFEPVLLESIAADTSG